MQKKKEENSKQINIAKKQVSIAKKLVNTAKKQVSIAKKQVNAAKKSGNLDLAYQICADNYPLWGAYNQACIILRSRPARSATARAISGAACSTGGKSSASSSVSDSAR